MKNPLSASSPWREWRIPLGYLFAFMAAMLPVPQVMVPKIGILSGLLDEEGKK